MEVGVIPLIGALTGLVSIIGGFWSDRLKSKNDLEKFKYDKKHQISKETFQKIFDKKWLLFKKLSHMMDEYRYKRAGIGLYELKGQYEDKKIYEYEIAIIYLKKILIEIKKDIFYISNSLEKKYRSLDFKLQRVEIDLEYDNKTIYSSDSEVQEIVSNQADEKFFKEHKEEIEEFFSSVEEEIAKVKDNIEFMTDDFLLSKKESVN
jgi:hypothetical protein